jgi:4-hydroxybenzoate polyprenyltransferase
MTNNETNPYVPPENRPTPQKSNTPWWAIGWFVFSIVCVSACVPGSDPFTSILTMGYGLISFAMGVGYARTRRG